MRKKQTTFLFKLSKILKKIYIFSLFEENISLKYSFNFFSILSAKAKIKRLEILKFYIYQKSPVTVNKYICFQYFLQISVFFSHIRECFENSLLYRLRDLRHLFEVFKISTFHKRIKICGN